MASTSVQKIFGRNNMPVPAEGATDLPMESAGFDGATAGAELGT